MTAETIVSDASPLIALERIGRLDILPALYERVLVPPAVRREIGEGLAGHAWLAQHALTHPPDRRVVAAALGRGESEAISLAIELRAHRIIVDDEPARRLAADLGLPIVGTLGILLAAKQGGTLTVIRPTVEALVATGFRIDPELIEMVLGRAGES